MWSVLVMSWSQARPVTVNDLINLGLATVISLFLWQLSRPIGLLPARPLTVATNALQSLITLNCQPQTHHAGTTHSSAPPFSMFRPRGVFSTCAAVAAPTASHTV